MLSSLKIFRISRRFISATAPLATDHFHQLFLDKVREYRMKNPDGKPTDPTPEFEEALDREFERLARHFGGGDDWRTEMIKFPKFVIPDVIIDPISLTDPEQQEMVPEQETNSEKKIKSEKDTKDEKKISAKEKTSKKKDTDEKKAPEGKKK